MARSMPCSRIRLGVRNRVSCEELFDITGCPFAARSRGATRVGLQLGRDRRRPPSSRPRRGPEAGPPRADIRAPCRRPCSCPRRRGGTPPARPRRRASAFSAQRAKLREQFPLADAEAQLPFSVFRSHARPLSRGHLRKFPRHWIGQIATGAKSLAAPLRPPEIRFVTCLRGAAQPRDNGLNPIDLVRRYCVQRSTGEPRKSFFMTTPDLNTFARAFGAPMRYGVGLRDFAESALGRGR